jgi:hypothetical protein
MKTDPELFALMRAEVDAADHAPSNHFLFNAYRLAQLAGLDASDGNLIDRLHVALQKFADAGALKAITGDQYCFPEHAKQFR